MTFRSAIIPYATGYTGVVTIRDTDSGPVLVKAESIEVGHAVPVPGETRNFYGKTVPRTERQASPEELTAHGRRVAALCAGSDVVMAVTQREDGISGQVAAAIQEALGAEIPRIRERSRKQSDSAEYVARLIRGWVTPAAGRRLLERAAAMLVAEQELMPAVEMAVAPPQDRWPLEAELRREVERQVASYTAPPEPPPPAPEPANTWAAIAARGQALREEFAVTPTAPEESDPTQPVMKVTRVIGDIRRSSEGPLLKPGDTIDPNDTLVASMPWGPNGPDGPSPSYEVDIVDETGASLVPKAVNPARLAGIDPGSGWLGLVIAEGLAAPLTVVHRETIHVGHTVRLAKPKKRKARDGTPYEVTREYVLTEEMVDEAADKAVATLRAYGVGSVVVEHTIAGGVSKGKDSASGVSHLLRTCWVATTIRERLRAAGITVERCSPLKWRNRVVGRKTRSGAPGKEGVPAVIAAAYSNWPEKSNDHERDAAGLALYGVIERAALEAARTPEAKEERGRVALDRSPRKSTAAAKREAAGCKCSANRHSRGCPLWREPKARKCDKRLRSKS